GTMATGVTTLPAGAALVISGTSNKELSVRTVDEDGTRTLYVTGVQACALALVFNNLAGALFDAQNDASIFYQCGPCGNPLTFNRSEERRVGKECRSRSIGVAFKKKRKGELQSRTLSLS